MHPTDGSIAFSFVSSLSSVSDANRNFLGVDPAIGRKNLQRVNAVIEKITNRYGHLVDLHAYFLTGDPSWFMATIEPSLRGASEVRRAGCVAKTC